MRKNFPIRMDRKFNVNNGVRFVTAKPKRNIDWVYWLSVAMIFGAVAYSVWEYM